MSDTYSVRKASLVALINGLPADCGGGVVDDPWGIINPRISWALSRWVSVALNPQPLPPDPPPDFWRVSGPFPQPWSALLLARTAIDRLVAEGQRAELAGGAEGSQESFRNRLMQLVDEFCGNRPPRWPLPQPWPFKLDASQIRPVDLVVMGVQFQNAAEAMGDNPMQGEFSAAADRLIETGLQRLQEGH